MAYRLGNIRNGWISQSERYSFLLLIVSLGAPQIPIHLFGLDVVATDLLFLLAGGLWTALVLFRQERFVWQNFYWLLAAYQFALLVSTVFSVDPMTSLKRFPQEGYLLCLCILTSNIISLKADIKRVVLAWLIGTSVAVAIGLATISLFYLVPSSPLLEFLTYHYGSVPVGDYPRITAGFVSASMFCNYLNVGLILTFHAANEGWLSPKLTIAFASTIMVAALFTFSIGLGGLALSIGVVAWLQGGLKSVTKRTIFVLGLLISLLSLFVSLFALAPYPGAHVLYTVPFVDIDLMPSARMLVWADAIGTFLSHPLTGLGLGKPVADVIFTNTDGSLSLLTDAHNSFLSVAAQNGIIGLIAFTYLVVSILRRWVTQIRRASSVTIFGALGIAFLCSFVYQGLTGSFEDARHLWVLIGIFWAADKMENHKA